MLGSVHQGVVAFCFGGITAQNDVLSQMPEVTIFGKAWLLQLGFHIEVIFLDLFAVDFVEQRLNLRRSKPVLPRSKLESSMSFKRYSQQRIIMHP